MTAKTAVVDRHTIEHVVRTACLAPSVHNTQPWRFVHHDDVLDLYADRSRQLRVLDPTGRQLHLSCGAALVHAKVAARALGLEVTCALMPDSRDPDHLARLELRAGPTPSDEQISLAQAALERRTYRSGFAAAPLPPAVLDVLRLVAEEQGAAIRRLEGDDLIELEVLMGRAELERRRDADYLAEVHRWTGGTEDGLRESLHPAPDRPAVIAVLTQADRAHDWVVAGEALGALLLAAADHGVLAQPLGAATDYEGNRTRLRALLHVVGTPQLVLRLGYPLHPVMPPPRRSLHDVLHDSED